MHVKSAEVGHTKEADGVPSAKRGKHDPHHGRNEACDFYTGLFGAEEWSSKCREELLEGLLQLSYFRL